MEPSMQRIHQVKSGVRVSESERGGYYFVCTVDVWIEMLVCDGRFPDKQVGVRWTIDHWQSHHEAFGSLDQRITQEEERWRIEIAKVVTTGWRDGSIGGPNEEQPSGNVWTLWGSSKQDVKCLPLGSVPPEFEFALFLEEHAKRYWDNNLDRNFRICLADFGKPDLR
jgi:hypothetical protein